MARIGPALEEALLYLAPNGGHEIVFVDDGSTDGTVERIVEHARHQPEVKLVRLSRNFGKDTALAAGLRYVSGAADNPIDVDLQDSDEGMRRKSGSWMRGAEGVSAVRGSASRHGGMRGGERGN